MKINIEHSFSGIYAIRNITTNKLYIGKSKNIYKRLHQHLSDIKYEHRNHNENPYLLNAVKKYSINDFEYIILEKTILNEKYLSERELYFIDKYKTIDRKFGYNLRRDSSTRMIVHDETRKKISERLKKEWKSGIRKNHAQKLANNWRNNKQRGIDQGLFFSKILTKYEYHLTKDGETIIVNYKKLKDLNLQNCLATIARKKTNKIIFKGYIIEKIRVNENIVQPD